jgi:hypothetical protein
VDKPQRGSSALSTSDFILTENNDRLLTNSG